MEFIAINFIEKSFVSFEPLRKKDHRVHEGHEEIFKMLVIRRALVESLYFCEM